MNPRQFATALAKLGLTQIAFANTIKVNERTVRDWKGGRSPVPTQIAMLLNLMLDTKTSAEELRS